MDLPSPTTKRIDPPPGQSMNPEGPSLDGSGVGANEQAGRTVLPGTRINNFMSVVDRFWARVPFAGDGECWLWMGYAHGNFPYGAIMVNKKTYGAHRISWILHFGEVADGLCVMHKCDVPQCVNPYHLRLGTHQENMRDMVSKGRSSKNVGERSGMAKFTDDDVRMIRRRYAAGENQMVLSRELGVTQQAISYILHVGWRHVA